MESINSFCLATGIDSPWLINYIVSMMTTEKQTNPFAALLENTPLIIMLCLGTWLCFTLWLPLGILYLVYIIVSLLLYMRSVCPYCRHLVKGNCPSGYHYIARLFFKAEQGKTFRTQFKKYTMVLYPLWFIPPVVALWLLFTLFSWQVLIIGILFSLDGFWVLPMLAKYITCRHCENKTECPRYSGKG